MPQFPHPDTVMSCEKAISAILTSIAMEETALSHIINAEGEKIQYVLQHIKKHETCCNAVENVLKVNESVASLLEQVADIQLILKSKMRLAVRFLNKCEPDAKNPGKTGKPC
jgi:hypothetical protein